MRNSDFSRLHDRILELIRAGHGVVTTAEISSELKISWNTAEKYLLELALENLVLRIKKAGVNLWVLAHEQKQKQKQRHHGAESIGVRYDE